MSVTIFLVGPRAAGKTTIGEGLARELGLPFVDLDQYLAARHGLTPAELVARHGWPMFRRLESEALREAAPGTPVVMATGGGTVLDEANRHYLRERGRVFYLSAPASVLAARLLTDPLTDQRPSLTGQPVAEEAAEVLAARESLYRNVAHEIVDAAAPPEAVLADILSRLVKA